MIEHPADFSDDPLDGGSALGWTTSIIVGATLLLAVFNAQALDGWANDLTPSPMVGHIVAATGAWREATDRLGLGSPRERLHGVWKAAERARHPTDADQR